MATYHPEAEMLGAGKGGMLDLVVRGPGLNDMWHRDPVLGDTPIRHVKNYACMETDPTPSKCTPYKSNYCYSSCKAPVIWIVGDTACSPLA